jgi:hypothetical protein
MRLNPKNRPLFLVFLQMMVTCWIWSGFRADFLWAGSSPLGTKRHPTGVALAFCLSFVQALSSFAAADRFALSLYYL